LESLYSPARTKLRIPELPRAHVPRPRLVHRLDDTVSGFSVTLVAGFAGAGKTVALAEWARSRPSGTVAWLSCDVADADRLQFWTALVGALRNLDAAIGVEALDLVHADGQLGHDAIASLVNDLCDLDDDRVLVIDDLHLVARSALEQLGELLERLPSPIRVVLSGRSDPRLPLHRWRAGGRLGEIRAAELRMDVAEVGQFVRSVGVEVSPTAAALLADRTEGWAAGVQLAALSMRYESEPDEFIRTFTGNDRNVADFLVGEVLERLDGDLVDFLLDTSVLDELSAPLCDALTGRSDSAAMLRGLERENLFVMPLDREHEFYRYHHLFAELLRRLLVSRHPGRAPVLHGVASDWYAQHNDPRRAVRHAIFANDPALVTRLLREHMYAEFFTGTSEMVRDWINELSHAHTNLSAELALEYALALLVVGELEEASVLLESADNAVVDTAPAPFRARLAVAHSLMLGLRGEIDSAIYAAERARGLVEPGVDAFVDGAVQQVLLRCYVYGDDLTAARRLYRSVLEDTDGPEQVDRVVLAGVFSQAELDAGELESARVCAESATAAIAKLGAEGHLGSTEALRTLGTIAYELDQLDDAERLFERCVEILGSARPTFLLLTRIELARVWNARGDREAAFANLDGARAALPSAMRSPLVDRVDAYRARLLAESGDAAGGFELAARMQSGRRRSVAEVRCYLAESDRDEARVVLHRISRHRATPRQALEASLLHARLSLQEEDGDPRGNLARALRLGRAIGFLRPLADEGPELAAAFAALLRYQPADSYSDRLAPILERSIAATPAQRVSLAAGVMLSDRERTVLQHLATRLTTREIAAELYVSMNTLRTHSKSIYRKLGVDSRAAATDSARGLGIL
jgi:LuxR family transcriptional regulator, maltose regulon positive regulatory protein